MKDIKTTEEKVLKLYQKVNPSFRPVENVELFEQMRRVREDIFFKKLKLPRKLFKGAKIISLGSGTGEYELFYALWGGEITCVDMNRFVMDRVVTLFSHYKLEHSLKKTYVQSYFDIDIGDERFDFVIADGTIVHTEDPMGTLRKFVGYVEKDGFIVVALTELAGGVQRNLQRNMLNILAGDDERKIIDYASLLFKEHIEHAIQIGGRTKEQVIYDTYINPKSKTPIIQDILKVFNENEISYYSGFPLINPFCLTSSAREPQHDLTDDGFYHLTLMNQIAWLLASDDDMNVAEEYFSSWKDSLKIFSDFLAEFYDITSKDTKIDRLEVALNHLGEFLEGNIVRPLEMFLSERLSEFYLDLEELLSMLRKKDIDALKNAKYRRLFKGTCGVGYTFVVGHKD